MFSVSDDPGIPMLLDVHDPIGKEKGECGATASEPLHPDLALGKRLLAMRGLEYVV